MYFIALDSETTGVNVNIHSIVQLSAIPVIDGVRQMPFDEYCQPASYETIDPKAVQVHGITPARMRTFQKPDVMLDKFIKYLRGFGVKFYIAGFNVGFDRRFLSAMFTRYGREQEFFELFELSVHDTYTRASSLKKTALKDQKSFSLASLCERFGISIEAHNALSDISATLDLDEKISALLGESKANKEQLSDYFEDIELPEMPQLHIHSSYSMVESVPTVEQWATWCVQNNVPAMAITDHSYAIALYETNLLNIPDKNTGKTKYPDLNIVHGIGLYLQIPEDKRLYPFDAWAKDIVGFSNIMKLSTLGFTREVVVDDVRRAVITKEELDQHSSGLIFGFGDPDFVLGDAVQNGKEDVDTVLSNYKDAFRDKEVFVELMPISITNQYSTKLSFQPIKESDVCRGDVGYAVVRELYRFACTNDMPIVPVSGAHFINPEDKLLQDCLASAAYDSGKRYHEIYNVKKSKDCFRLLSGIIGPELTGERFIGWIQNANNIADRCKGVHRIYEYRLPQIDIPDHIKEQTEDYNKQLLILTIERCKAHGRWSDDPVYVDRFRREIDVIAKNKTLNFLPYFLMYEEIAATARNLNIFPGIARGSAGGSLLSYYLKIIHVDPIVNDLPFERFLSHERIEVKSFPDIDADFANREPIIAFLQKKFGLGFAQIATFSKMKTKTAIKQVMMALYGKHARDPEVMEICDLIPDSPQGVDEKNFLYGYTDREGMYHAGIVETVPEVQKFFENRPAVKNMMDRLIGITRGLGRHASGFVVSSLDLSAGVTPLIYLPSEGLYMTQMAAPMIDKSGLIKADLLSVNTLQMIQDAVALIKERTGTDLMEEDDRGVAAIYRLPESKKVYREFRNANTDSSFQFNSGLIKGLLPGFAPQSRKDLSALTALGRPGALDVEVEPGISATQYYIEVRQGNKPPKYIHPDLERILKSTLSVVAYQEQLMQILVEFAGYTLGEADQIRSAIAKKKRDVMQKAYAKVRLETQKIGWTPEQADALCGVLEAYSNYSFNLSHSRAYSETGYITMYLKTIYPTEWWTAVLNNEKDEDNMRLFASLLRGKLLAPTIKSIYDSFTPKGDKIYAPLWSIKGVGHGVAKDLIQKGPYKNAAELAAMTAGTAFTVTAFGPMVNARCFDVMFDNRVPYLDARKHFIETFRRIRKSQAKTLVNPDFLDPTPISRFLMEKNAYTLFSTRVCEDAMLRETIVSSMQDEITYTGSAVVPFQYSNGNGSEPISILAGFDELQRAPEIEGYYGIFCLFKKSETRSGISKKNGRPWHNVTVYLSDGCEDDAWAWWDKRAPLRLPTDSIILVIGRAKKNWRGRIVLDIAKVESIQDV